MGPETVERINQLLQEVDEKIESLRDKVNGILDWVPWGLGWVVDKFMSLWDKAMDKLGEFWDKVQEFVSHIGAPWDLDAAKDSWIDAGGPVAARASEADRSQSAVDTEWKGQAADRYALSLAAQNKALTAVQSKLTSVMGPALGKVSSALYIFYGAIIAAILALIAGIVLATGEAVSVLGLPAVPPTVITAIVVAIGAISAAILNLRGQASDANTEFLKVANETGDFGAQNWPNAVLG
jgi:uncharacterized protein YukE